MVPPAEMGAPVVPAGECLAEGKSVLGFMCRTDFDHELGEAADGVRVYPSAATLREHRPCVTECGMVRVRVVLDAVIDEGKDWS